MSGWERHFAPGEVRAELQRILASKAFDASERNRRFLQFIVEETLEGRADRIKAYGVATLVFGRGESFDPQTDPVVRIEASRLRRSIERYYLTAGKVDPIRIAIPKGSYVPTFETNEPEPAASVGQTEHENRRRVAGERTHPRFAHRRAVAAGTSAVGLLCLWFVAAWLFGITPFSDFREAPPVTQHGPAILVTAFDEDGIAPEFPNFTRGLTRQVIVALTRFNDLFVFGPETTFGYAGNIDRKRLRADLGVDFLLEGGATITADEFALDVLLVDTQTGQYLWAERFTGKLGVDDIFKVREEVANRVARALAQPYGVIFTNKARESEGKPPGTLTSYDCVIRFDQYWRSYRLELYAPVRACLEQAVVADPGYADAFASLSLIYSDANRFELDEGAVDGDPRQRALELAGRAVELGPRSVRSYRALALALWLANDVRRSLEALETGHALNPNDTEVLAELGLYYAMRARWDEGLPLLRESFARNPWQPTLYRLGLFLHHFANGHFAEALAEAKLVDTPNSIYGHLAVAAAAAKLGRTRVAEAALQKLLLIDPGYGAHVVADLIRHNVHPELIGALVDGLRDAGLDVATSAPVSRS